MALRFVEIHNRTHMCTNYGGFFHVEMSYQPVKLASRLRLEIKTVHSEITIPLEIDHP